MADNKTAVQRGNRMSKMREEERKKDMKAGSTAPEKSLRPKKRPATVDMSPNAEAKDQEHVKKFKQGGMVGGCSDAQVKGTKFSGTY
jgi:hypothetical protein